METSHEKALKPKSKAALKRESKEAWKNRHNDPNYKGVGPGYLSTEIKKAAESTPKKKDRYGWAGRVGNAHMRNQKAETEKGYREGYR